MIQLRLLGRIVIGLVLALGSYAAPAAAQEANPAGTFNRMCLIFDRSGSMIAKLDPAWEKVAGLARRYRLQPEDELVVVALDDDPTKIYDGPAGALVRGGNRVLNLLRKIAPSRGTDVITAIEICADELHRDARPSRLLLWSFSDLYVDDSPRRRFRRAEAFDWSLLRNVEARFYYVDSGKGGAHIRGWRRLLRDRGVDAALLDPLQSEHELYEPLPVRQSGDEGALAVGAAHAVGVTLGWGVKLFAVVIALGMLAAVGQTLFRRGRRAGT